jgi:ubiquinone/menaquinone biosynthesis C-methylase UbiE
MSQGQTDSRCGCGRGGTVFVIKQFFQPLSVQGIDLSPNAIAFCRANHHYDNLRFDEGDSEKLSFDTEQFDVVTNVESSHNYPNLSEFYAEVFRVLQKLSSFAVTEGSHRHRYHCQQQKG